MGSLNFWAGEDGGGYVLIFVFALDGQHGAN